jgi:hypothetical protein
MQRYKMPKLYNIIAEVHSGASVDKGYRVKVSLPELGIFINGFMVYRPNPKFPQWGVTPPSRLAGRGKWAPIVEFNKKMSLWEEIFDECVAVAQIEESARNDVVITDISDDPINFDDIPF